MTLTQITLGNFKCFSSVSLKMAPLTVLTGYNAGGKSTMLQAILLLAQSLRHAADDNLLALNGDMVQLGNPGDVIHRSATNSRAIRFALATDTASAEWAFEASSGQRGMLSLIDRPSEGGSSPRLGLSEGVDPDLLSVVRTATFLSTARAVDADVMPVPSNGSRPSWDVGRDGAYAAYILDQSGAEAVDIGRRTLETSAETVQGQVDGWLSLLFPGARASAKALEDVPLMKLEFRTGRAAGWVKPSNIGFGLGYAFPLLVALMTAPRGSLFIVDSPEAHLHPRAQSLLGRMLAQIASAGVQIAIETHSDHLLNGIRLGLLDKLIAPPDVAVHFFAASEEERIVTTLEVNDKGALSEWPTGFFDQAINDLVELS